MEENKLNTKELYLLLKYIVTLNISHNYMRVIIYLLPELIDSNENNGVNIDIKVLSDKLGIRQNEMQNIIPSLIDIDIIKSIEHNQYSGIYYLHHHTAEELNNKITALDELFISQQMVYDMTTNSGDANEIDTSIQDSKYLKPDELKENTTYLLHLFTTIDDNKYADYDIHIIFIYPDAGMQYCFAATGDDGKMEYLPFSELRYPGCPTCYDTAPGAMRYRISEKPHTTNQIEQI